MSARAEEVMKYLKPSRVLTPIIIGLGVASYLLYKNFLPGAFDGIKFNMHSILWIVLAVLMVVVRDFSYMVRIKILTDNELNWQKCFEVIMLWEFASAVAPAILGGGFAFAVLIINREKISFGKSISVVMFSSFLDGMFFAIFCPLIYFTLGRTALFSTLNSSALQQLSHGTELYYSFWFIYFVVLAYKFFIAYALFINARGVKAFLIKLFSIKVLRRWRHNARETGTELVLASKQIKGKTFNYWLTSFAATCASWSARFIIINCIIMAFSNVDIQHYLLYARQVVVGLFMIVSPTPGGSGIAEKMFGVFLGEFIDNKSLTYALALLWRIISYYPYIFIGIIILPKWIRRVFAEE